MSTIEDYTTLKLILRFVLKMMCLSTIEDYTTLKLMAKFVGMKNCLSTIEDYTTLKPQILKFEETASTTMR